MVKYFLISEILNIEEEMCVLESKTQSCSLSHIHHNQVTSKTCWVYFSKILFFQTFPPLTATTPQVRPTSAEKDVLLEAPPRISSQSPIHLICTHSPD